MADWRDEVRFDLKGHAVNHLSFEVDNQFVAIRYNDADSLMTGTGRIVVQRRNAEGGEPVGHIRVHDDEHILIEGDDVALMGAFTGTIRLALPRPNANAPPVRQNAVPGLHVTKRRAKDEGLERLRLEEAEDRAKRLSDFNPNAMDIVDRIDSIPLGPYTVARLLAAICGGTKNDAMAIVYTGDKPIYPLDPKPRDKRFDPRQDQDIAKHAEALMVAGGRGARIAYLESLPEATQKRMHAHFGRDSPDYRQRQILRSVMAQRLKEAKAFLKGPSYYGDRELVTHGRHCDMPLHFRDFVRDLPSEERRGMHWELREVP